MKFMLLLLRDLTWKKKKSLRLKRFYFFSHKWGNTVPNTVTLFFWCLRTYLLLLWFLIFISHTFPIIKLTGYSFKIKRKLNLTTLKRSVLWIIFWYFIPWTYFKRKNSETSKCMEEFKINTIFHLIKKPWFFFFFFFRFRSPPRKWNNQTWL